MSPKEPHVEVVDHPPAAPEDYDYPVEDQSWSASAPAYASTTMDVSDEIQRLKADLRLAEQNIDFFVFKIDETIFKIKTEQRRQAALTRRLISLLEQS